MRFFNAFQITTLFAAAPFIVSWLHNSTFPFVSAAFWLSIVIYIILFMVHVVGIVALVDK